MSSDQIVALMEYLAACGVWSANIRIDREQTAREVMDATGSTGSRKGSAVHCGEGAERRLWRQWVAWHKGVSMIMTTAPEAAPEEVTHVV